LRRPYLCENSSSGGGLQRQTLRARDAPAEPGTKSLKLIAIIEMEKGLACFPVEGKPGARISTVVDDFDGAHEGRSQRRTTPEPRRYDGSRPKNDQQFMDDIHKLFVVPLCTIGVFESGTVKLRTSISFPVPMMVRLLALCAPAMNPMLIRIRIRGRSRGLPTISRSGFWPKP
jgi:hypothetical protein